MRFKVVEKMGSCTQIDWWDRRTNCAGPPHCYL
jgi:hypothetical protein